MSDSASESRRFVRRDDRGPIAVLTLDRPERRNALGRVLVDQLSDALGRAAVEPNVRAVVLTGAPPVFCAGMDLKESLVSAPTPQAEKQAVDAVQAIADLVQQLHGLPKPIVAALGGDAYAGGAGLALACDLVVAAEHVRIGYPEVRRGLVAAVVLYDLVRQAGERRARELLLTGAPIDAATAERWGLVNRVVPAESCLPAALELAQGLAASGPKALETIKHLLDEAGGRPDLRGAAAVTAAVRVSEEAIEGMRAFFEKRPPRWAEGA